MRKRFDFRNSDRRRPTLSLRSYYKLAMINENNVWTCHYRCSMMFLRIVLNKSSLEWDYSLSGDA